jgi:hypothetical protein
MILVLSGLVPGESPAAREENPGAYGGKLKKGSIIEMAERKFEA